MKFLNIFNKQKKNVTSEIFTYPEYHKNKYESVSLVDILVETWNSLNADLISPYLEDDFRYNSAWVENTIEGKGLYLDYLRKKFTTIKESGDIPTADVIEDNGRLRPRLRQRGNSVETILDITEHDGKISRIFMRPPVNISIIDMDEWGDLEQGYRVVLQTCLQIGGKAIQDYVSSKGLTFPDFSWLQTNLIWPSFQHLCFRYLSNVYSIILAVHGFSSSSGREDDRIIVAKQDYENLLHECEKNNLIPCILPIAIRSQVTMIDDVHLLHAVTGEHITIDNIIQKEQVPMSEWEINSMGIQTVVEYLKKENCQINSYCDVVGIEPQIWFKKDEKTSYIIVRSIPVGKRKEKFVINKNSLSRFADYDGYFADVQFSSSNPVLRDGLGLSKRDTDEDVWMWRGDSFYCNFKGIQEIENAIVTNDFIEVCEKELYDIK